MKITLMNPLPHRLPARLTSRLVSCAMALACLGVVAPAAAQPAAPGAPVALGIHHLKFVVADLDKSKAFYEAAFGAKQAMDHRKPDGTLFAYILTFPGLGTELELRLDPAAAKSQQGLDPITLTVDGPGDLERWRTHFQARNLRHSPVLVGLVGWLLVVEDPDGRRLRLYTKQTHGPEIKPSWDSPWIN